MNLEEILITVQRPGRYIGGEWNAVKKDWSADKVKFLLAFPDTYEIGMSCLGIKIVYGLLNERPDCLCERVFSPWADMEKALRDNDIPLFSLESRRPMNEFDIVGISLAYEMSYTNVLNLLDLGRIPKRSSDRGDGDPIVIAGGPACYNPEPISDFIDLFLIGEGEDAIGEIIDEYKSAKREGVHDRKEMLRRLSKVSGVYVPSLYAVEYNDDGTIKKSYGLYDYAPSRIRKRFVQDFDNAFYPTKQIVPNIQVVHDRIPLEIMRGCKHACRFCQASAIYRPCRERSIDNLLRLARESYDMTGHDEISLLSLSSVDHSRIRDIVIRLNEEFVGKAVAVSVPSLRAEDALQDLPALIAKVKKSGLTFAPEVGSDRLRKVLRKEIDVERLFKAAAESFKNGWKGVKLYFMIGIPLEEDADILAIAEFAKKVSDLKRAIDGHPARVTLSVNAFIPKPHTIFQWEPMCGMASLAGKMELLRKSIKSRAIELDLNPIKMSYMEAVFSRGDRRLSQVIYEAWKAGSRFDAWGDKFDFNRWIESFKVSGLDPDFYVIRKRAVQEILPWDFIDIGMDKDVMAREALSVLAP